MQLKKYISYLIYLSLLFLTGSCEKDLQLPATGESKIVLLGELAAGDSIFIRGGQSIPFRSGNSYQTEYLADLKVHISGGGIEADLYGELDDYAQMEPMLAFHHAHKVQAGSSYRISAQSEGKQEATALIDIPKPFTARISDSMYTNFAGKACMAFDVQIEDVADTNYYVIEVLQQPFTVEPAFFFDGRWWKQSENFDLYDSLLFAGQDIPERIDSFPLNTFFRVSFFTNDHQSTHVQEGNHLDPTGRVLLQDKNFNGSKHISRIFIPLENIVTQEPFSGLQTLILVKSIPEYYYRYLDAYNQIDPSGLSGNNNIPVRLIGNIAGGSGIIGAAYKHTFRFLF
jgi:hypothetical protein